MTELLDQLFSLRGKTALVTGAGGNIGSVLAKALAEVGATVALHDLIAEKLVEPQRAIEAAGGQAIPFTADLADVESCRNLVDKAHQTLGRLDILINCAGTNRRKPIVEVTPEDFEAIVAVNLRSIYFLSQAAYPLMKAQGGGKIINISSLSAKYSFNTISVYATTKAAVSQLTKAMAREWVKDNIQVNSIEPGFVQTEFTRPLWDDEYRAQWFRNFIPLGRLAQPGELVGTVLLLATHASSYLTGQAIVIDGGILSGSSWERPEFSG